MTGTQKIRDLAIVAAVLAGETQGSVAKRYELTRPRISQIMAAYKEKRRAESAHAAEGPQ